MKDLRVDLESLREEAFPRQHTSSEAAVVPSSGSTPAVPQPGTNTGAVPRRRHRALVGAAAVLVAAILAGAGGWFWFTHRVQDIRVPPELTVTRLTANPADLSVSSARISPDGKYVAYSDPTGIQVRVIDTGETQRLPDTRGMTVYAWTGDSTKIRAARCDLLACAGWDLSILGGSRQPSGATWPASEPFRTTSDGSRLLTITSSGYVKVNLLDGNPAKTLVHGADYSRGAAWSTDGKSIYFASGAGVIERVSVSGGSPSPTFRADQGTEVADIGPALSDGRLFAVLVKTTQSGLRAALVEIRTAAPDVTRARDLTESGPDPIEQVSASSDGSRFTFVRTTAQWDVYVAELDARHTVLTTPRRLTLDERNDIAVGWTPESARVIFASDRNGNSDLFKQQLDSDVAEPFVVSPGQEGTTRVTSDGRWVLYTYYEPNKPTWIMRVPLVGGRPESLVSDPPSAEVYCHCSFHGRCVLLERGTTSSPLTVFALDPILGKQQELTQIPSGTSGANLTPDGDHIAYIVPEERGIQNRIRIVSFHGEPPHDIVVKDAVRLGSLDSFPTGGFFSLETASSHRKLLFVTPDGMSKVLWSPEQLDAGFALASPDGKHLAMQAASHQSNVWLVNQR
jgi:Tol biopolymer transport system component